MPVSNQEVKTEQCGIATIFSVTGDLYVGRVHIIATSQLQGLQLLKVNEWVCMTLLIYVALITVTKGFMEADASSGGE